MIDLYYFLNKTIEFVQLILKHLPQEFSNELQNRTIRSEDNINPKLTIHTDT